MSLLIVLDGLPHEAKVGALAMATGKSVAAWTRLLAAPSLVRVVAHVSSQEEAGVVVKRLQTEGLSASVIDAAEAAAAVDEAFEAAFAEQLRDGLVFIRADGEDLEVESREVRSMTAGDQIVDGQRGYFVVLGLRQKPGAVVLRLPGSEVSKLVPEPPAGGASEDEARMQGLIAAIARLAPHAKLERMDSGAVPPPALGALGSRDLTCAAIVGAWLERRAPAVSSASKADAPHLPFHGEDAPLPPRPPPSPVRAPETEEERQARMRDVEASIAAIDKKAAQARGRGAPSQPHETGDASPPKRSVDRRAVLAAGGVAAIAIAVGAVIALKPPAQATGTVKLGERWRTPWGPTFIYTSTYDASIGGVPNVGFAIDVEHAGEREPLRIPAHEAKRGRESFGVRWHIEEHESGGAWLKVAASISRSP